MEALSASFANFLVAASVGLTRATTRLAETVVDTGAGPNLIREDVLPRSWMRYKRELPVSFRIIDANGKILNPEAIIPLYVRMGKTVMQSLFVVVRNLSVPCIL